MQPQYVNEYGQAVDRWGMVPQQRRPTVEAPKDKGNWLTNSLSTAGGILGGIGGSFLGPGIGTAAGGALGAGAGKFLENLLEGNDVGEGVLGEAALGTLGGIGKGFKAIKGAAGALKSGQGANAAQDILRFGVPAGTPNVANRASRVLDDAGKRLISSQSKITPSQARQMGISPVEALGRVNERTGLTNLDDMATVARGMTGGKDSTLDMLTREAVGSSKGVNIPDLRGQAQGLLDDMGSLVPDSQRNRLLNQTVRAGTTMRGGSKGSLSDLADPKAALDQANAFRGTARELTNSFTATPEQKQLANVYNSLAKNVEDSIYASPGVGESIPSLVKAGADDILFKAQDLRAAGDIPQAKALEKIGQELRGVKDIKDLRTFKKDFVDVGKIDAATAQAEGTRSLTGENVTGQIKSALFDAAKPGVGGASRSAAKMLQGGVPGAGMPDWAKIGGTQLGGRALLGALPGQSDMTSPQTMEDPSAVPTQPDMSSASVLGSPGSAPKSTYSLENVTKDIQNDLARTGGENMEKYMKLYEFLNPMIEGSKANATTQKALSQSANADATLGQLEGMMQQAGGAGGILGGNVNSFLGGIGLNNEAKTYNDLASGSVTQIAKALGETGAMSDADRVAYANLIPKITDTPEVANAKFAALRDRMATAQQNTLQYGAGSGIEDALAAAGY